METVQDIYIKSSTKEQEPSVSALDTALAHRLKAGDKAAFHDLYETYAGLLFTIARRYARSHTEAEDWLQDAFVQIYKKIDTFNEEGSFEGWLKRVVVNKCLSSLRRKHLISDVTYDDLGPSSEQNIAPKALDTINAENILECFKELPSGARTVLNLHAIDGYEHSEIASELGISESASRSQLSKARAQLKVVLINRGIL